MALLIIPMMWVVNGLLTEMSNLIYLHVLTPDNDGDGQLIRSMSGPTMTMMK